MGREVAVVALGGSRVGGVYFGVVVPVLTDVVLVGDGFRLVISVVVVLLVVVFTRRVP